MEMMTDPNHMGAERLAANMESYLASVEISHEGRGDQREGCRNREVMWLLVKRSWNLGRLEEKRKRFFSLLKPKAYVIMWLTDRAVFSRTCLI